MEKDVMKIEDELQRLYSLQRPPLVKGRYYDNLLGEVGGFNFHEMRHRPNLIYSFPIVLYGDVVLDRIGVNIMRVQDTCEMRLGIYESVYSSNEETFPGQLILDSNKIKITAAINYEVVINNGFAPGIYWLAMIASEGESSLRAYSRDSVAYSIGGFRTLREINSCMMITKEQAYGPLPSVFGEGVYNTEERYIPRIAVRVQPDMAKKPMKAV